MGRIERYLAVLLLQRLGVTAFGMVALLGVLDALGSADILPPDAGLAGSLRYMVLRMPILFDRTLPISFLLAVLLTYVALIRRNELVAIIGAGLSVVGQMKALLPVVILSMGLGAVMIDVASPAATRALEDWLGPEALREESREPQTLWLAEERWLVEIEGASGGTLHGLTLFERDAVGVILSVTRAPLARYEAKGWRLEGPAQLRYDGATPMPPDLWATTQTPETLRLLLSEPRDLSVANLAALSQMTKSGNRPAAAYTVWLLNRLILPLVGVGLMMLAVPMMQRYGRRESGYLAMALATGAGFAYMLVDGILKAFAERGSLDVLVAVLVPTGMLIAAGLVLALRRQGPG